MLARSFLSATKLAISEEQKDALIRVLNAFERGEFVHTTLRLNDARASDLTNGFNMQWWGNEFSSSTVHCGTIHCIGGWAEQLSGSNLFLRADFNNMNWPTALEELFYPGSGTNTAYDYRSITIEQATQALLNYLTTGWPDWKKVLTSQAN